MTKTGFVHGADDVSTDRPDRLSMAKLIVWLCLALILVMGLIPTRAVAANPETVQTAWRLLDYIAVDYNGAVANGRIISEAEYGEMREFSATVAVQLRTLDPVPARASLLERSDALRQAIESKARPGKVADLARDLGRDLLKAYPVPLAPRSLPDMERGAALYQSQCASCHGQSGNGRGLAAIQLNPPPIDFTDRERASQRSIFALEQVIAQGLEGTAMQSFAQLPSDDRWALAFYVGTLSYDGPLARRGETIWKSDADVRAKIPDLQTLVGLTPRALAGQIGPDKAAAVMAYLRSSPEALEGKGAGSLALTRSRLGETLVAYRSGDRANATRLALSAYLDGFEPVEPQLSARDPSLMREIEVGMAELRSRIAKGEPAKRVEQQIIHLDSLFSRAEQALAGRSASGISTFLSALTILLREGVEALLLVVAMIAFLRKSDRDDAIPYVHGGWIVALVAGALTWFAATAFISVSGASRELIEGFGAIFAALVLVSVGIWMHGKSQANAWQNYIKERMNRALGRGSAWFLFGLAFLIVYREVFETILFYAAMWNDDPTAVLAGAGVGSVLLGIIAWLMLRYSRKLPIAQFFRYSSALIAVLAVVLIGKGIAAIQEAGLIDVTPLSQVPRIELLGLFPSVEVVVAQVVALVVLAAGFFWNQRKARGEN